MEIWAGPISDTEVYPYQQTMTCFSESVHVAFYKLYLLEPDAEFSTAMRAKLQTCLNAAPAKDQVVAEGQWLSFMPRPGLISAWRTRAESILKSCGLTDLTNIEAGVLVVLRSGVPGTLNATEYEAYVQQCQDPLTQVAYHNPQDLPKHFDGYVDRFDLPVPLDVRQPDVLASLHHSLGLTLSETEKNTLHQAFAALDRPATATECMMFAQINSEHCRHHYFNATWQHAGQSIDGLFTMIKSTTAAASVGVLSAYHDNGAVIEGYPSHIWQRDPLSHRYTAHHLPAHWVIKAETHNHPTGLMPFEGAATGCGGELRDESATALGAIPKMGWVGFAVSDLHLPDYPRPWELPKNHAPHLASPLKIMQTAPIGAARFSNEFGRPLLCGFFRTLEQTQATDTLRWGYHKPLMLAGGMGQLNSEVVEKTALPVSTPLVVLGGPALLVGLGGGAASSTQSTQVTQARDLASVQRSNPEMQRRCQAVINACVMLQEQTPLLSIHDVGAGGLANAIPELVAQAGRGCMVQLESIPVAQSGMSALEIWCNESQERFVLAVQAHALPVLLDIAAAEGCPIAVVGTVIAEQKIILESEHTDQLYVDLPTDVLFNAAEKIALTYQTYQTSCQPWPEQEWDIEAAARLVLQRPAVADKSFLITIADRSVGGCVVRDQMVGPWQVPVADQAIICSSFEGYEGAAMAIGERLPVAVDDPVAAIRLALAEAITNLAGVGIGALHHIKCSANWAADATDEVQLHALYAAVQAVSTEYATSLGLAIPVGKDSLSMVTQWPSDTGVNQVVQSPTTGVISAYAPVLDVRKCLTPMLAADTTAPLVWLGFKSKTQGLGGSVLATCYKMQGYITADAPKATALKNFFDLVQRCIQEDIALAYHDRSDGGLFITLCEMAFCARKGLDICLDGVAEHLLQALFYEGCGAVLQIKAAQVPKLKAWVEATDLVFVELGHIRTDHQMCFQWQGKTVLNGLRYDWRRLWSMTSYRMRTLRDNPETAKALFDSLWDADDPGLAAVKVPEALTSAQNKDFSKMPNVNLGVKPQVGILRAPGTQGHMEMAAAFDQAGFQSIDLHLSTLLEARESLGTLQCLAICGGFSFGDVFGAGRGVAQIMLQRPFLQDAMQTFFERPDTLTLGVCNGCQILSEIATLIPGQPTWPTLVDNHSLQFESRMVLVEVMPSKSVFLSGMAGAILPVVVAHAQGQMQLPDTIDFNAYIRSGLACMRFVTSSHQPALIYPSNPNGSVGGLTGVTSADGRVTLMMPHPERLLRPINYSWCPDDWAVSPWCNMFKQARQWLNN